MITFLTWCWYNPTYRWNDIYLSTAEKVLVLRDMLSRHYDRPFRFVCVTDRHMPDVDTFPVWTDPDPHMCWRRIKLFKPELAHALAAGTSHLLSLDLDTVIRGNITEMVDWAEQFDVCFLGNRSAGAAAAGVRMHGAGFMMLRPGVHPEVWDDYTPERAEEARQRFMLTASDQTWFTEKLQGPDIGQWPLNRNVALIRHIMARYRQSRKPPPERIRVVAYAGPWDPTTVEWPGITEHWRRNNASELSRLDLVHRQPCLPFVDVPRGSAVEHDAGGGVLG